MGKVLVTIIVVGVLVGLWELVAVTSVVVRALVCAGAVVGTFVEVLTVDMRVGVVIIVSNVTVDLLADIMIGVLTNVGVDALLYVNANVFTVVYTALEFPVSTPLEGFGRCAAFDW